MSHLLNQVQQHLSDDVIVQITRQLGAQDPNQVKQASQDVAALLLDAISRSASNQRSGDGLLGALKRDHDGGILGNLVGILSGKQRSSSPKTTNGEGIVTHLLGNRQLEAAQMISQRSGLHIFKSGVLMQLLGPVVMGVVGQQQRKGGLDLGGLANILLGGAQQGGRSGGGGGLFGKLLDLDKDGSAMDDLINIGMKILKK